jgi:hypothetical protein
MSDASRFEFTCRGCGAAVLVVDGQLMEVDLEKLRDHLRQRHPTAAIAVDASAGAVLAEFDVTGERA